MRTSWEVLWEFRKFATQAKEQYSEERVNRIRNHSCVFVYYKPRERSHDAHERTLHHGAFISVRTSLQSFEQWQLAASKSPIQSICILSSYIFSCTVSEMFRERSRKILDDLLVQEWHLVDETAQLHTWAVLPHSNMLQCLDFPRDNIFKHRLLPEYGKYFDCLKKK